MTEEQIVKGLYCCQTVYERKCEICSYSIFKKKYISIETCESKMKADVLNLVTKLREKENEFESI
jgi:hypothetical protein